METAEDENHGRVEMYTVPWEWYVVGRTEASCLWSNDWKS